MLLHNALQRYTCFTPSTFRQTAICNNYETSHVVIYVTYPFYTKVRENLTHKCHWASHKLYTTDALPCHIHLHVCLSIMDSHIRAAKKNASHGNEVLPLRYNVFHTKTMLPTRKSVPRSSRQSDQTKTWRKLQWYWHVSRLSGVAKTILQGTVKGEKKTRQTEEEVGRQYQGMDRPGGRQVPEGSGEQRKMEETVCEVICVAPTTTVVKA